MMNYKNEIMRRDKRIENYKNTVEELREEIEGLRQLLDCAAANIVLLTKEKGGKITLSKTEVSDALGKYHLGAKRDKDGNYELEIKES